MMDILKPPTDNLYKFIAISGPIIFLASFIFPQIIYKDYAVNFAEIGGDLRVLELQKYRLKTNIDREPTIPSENMKICVLELKQARSNIDEGLSEVYRKSELRVFLSYYGRRWQLIGLIGELIGIVMMIGGFY